MDGPLHARLINAEGELIAEGSCRLDERAGTAMLEPQREQSAIQKERGVLALELDSGRSLPVSDRTMVVHMRAPGSGDDASRRRVFYRLRLLRERHGASSFPLQTSRATAQEANATGAVSEGSLSAPPPLERPRLSGETPAAR